MNAGEHLQAEVGPAHAAARLDRMQRDAALDRVGSITRAIAVTSVAAAMAIGVYVSRVFPGHSSSTPTTITGTDGQTTAPSTSGSPSSGTSSSGSSAATGGATNTTLSPPATAPAPTQQQAPVVSGST